MKTKMDNMPLRMFLVCLIASLMLLAIPHAFAMEYHHSEEALNNKLFEKQFSPYAGREYPTRVLWGDQHLHTEISVEKP